jgi:hypothetical protein
VGEQSRVVLTCQSPLTPAQPCNGFIKRRAPPPTNNTPLLQSPTSIAKELNMGATVSQLWAPPPITVGLIGLRSAGKTTMVHKLSGNSDPVKPSIESEVSFCRQLKSQH